jgi:hypothetical protein
MSSSFSASSVSVSTSTVAYGIWSQTTTGSWAPTSFADSVMPQSPLTIFSATSSPASLSPSPPHTPEGKSIEVRARHPYQRSFTTARSAIGRGSLDSAAVPTRVFAITNSPQMGPSKSPSISSLGSGSPGPGSPSISSPGLSMTDSPPLRAYSSPGSAPSQLALNVSTVSMQAFSLTPAAITATDSIRVGISLPRSASASSGLIRW